VAVDADIAAYVSTPIDTGDDTVDHHGCVADVGAAFPAWRCNTIAECVEQVLTTGESVPTVATHVGVAGGAGRRGHR
jgi:hypothetical protein